MDKEIEYTHTHTTHGMFRMEKYNNCKNKNKTLRGCAQQQTVGDSGKRELEDGKIKITSSEQQTENRVKKYTRFR